MTGVWNMRDIHLTLSYDSCLLLLSAIDRYQMELEDRYKRASYLFQAYGEERHKQLSENNRSLLLIRMYQVDNLKSLVLSSMPISDSNYS